MVKSPKNFLIDANTLMAAARLYYAYDLLPSFWEIFGEKKEGNVVLLDIVKNEIDKGQDELQKWVMEKQDDFQCKVKIPDVASYFGVKVHNLYYMMRQLGIKI